MRQPIIVPIRTYSTPNTREHWAARARRARTQRRAAYWAVPAYAVTVPTVVTLTRIAPRTLDDDNLRGALKACRDGVADRLDIDDADPRVTWAYGQEKGAPREYAVRVEIQPE